MMVSEGKNHPKEAIFFILSNCWLTLLIFADYSREHSRSEGAASSIDEHSQPPAPDRISEQADEVDLLDVGNWDIGASKQAPQQQGQYDSHQYGGPPLTDPIPNHHQQYYQQQPQQQYYEQHIPVVSGHDQNAMVLVGAPQAYPGAPSAPQSYPAPQQPYGSSQQSYGAPQQGLGSPQQAYQAPPDQRGQAPQGYPAVTQPQNPWAQSQQAQPPQPNPQYQMGY
jgi:hypothetical protein